MNRIVGCNLLKTVFVLCIGTIVLTGCGSPGASKSSEAEITELTLTIGGIDYPVDFSEDNAATIGLSSSVSSVTVASVTLSAGASGLAKGDELPVSNDKVSITVTAEDGTTTQTYTISLSIISARELERSTLTVDGVQPDNYRMSYGAFAVESSMANADVRFAVRDASSDKPTADEIRNSAATVVYTLGTEPINIFIGFHMDTDLFDANTDWTHVDYAALGTGAVGTGAVKESKVNEAKLTEDTRYTLYAVDDDATTDTVYTLLALKPIRLQQVRLTRMCSTICL